MPMGERALIAVTSPLQVGAHLDLESLHILDEVGPYSV